MLTRKKEALLLQMINNLADCIQVQTEKIKRLEDQVALMQAAERRRSEERVRGVSR